MKQCRVMFVCSGNTCRSPMAEAVMRQAAKEQGLNIVVSSAGLYTTYEEMNEKSRIALQKRGIAFDEEFVSTQISAELMDKSDLIVTMTKSLKSELIRRSSPETAKKVYAASDFTAEDIPDPYLMGQAAYDATLEKIIKTTEEIIKKIKTAF